MFTYIFSSLIREKILLVRYNYAVNHFVLLKFTTSYNRSLFLISPCDLIIRMYGVDCDIYHSSLLEKCHRIFIVIEVNEIHVCTNNVS